MPYNDSEELNPTSLAYVEDLYAAFLADPAAIPEEWRAHLEEMRRIDKGRETAPVGPSFRPASLFNPVPGGNGAHVATPAPAGGRVSGATAVVSAAVERQDRVDQLVRAYRTMGHLCARLDPLGRSRKAVPEIEYSYHGLSETDLDAPVSARTIKGFEKGTLRELIQRLQNTYCRSIGVQFMHVDDQDVKSWLEERMESCENRLQLSRDEQIRIFQKLTDAVALEEFIQKKFMGAKSFSLEGAESFIPLLDLTIEKAAEQHTEEIVIAMAHRGRLNVLANIMGKNPRAIFFEFDDDDATGLIHHGDVKYHLGYSTDHVASTGRRVHLTLCFNASHLEISNPVALGRVRAKQDRAGDIDRRKVLGIAIHGDAAFIGEGISQETFNISELSAYTTGGTLHIVTNNQIGFTTLPEQDRSTAYCTDVAKMLDIPVFHVNGEDPEAVAQVVRLALDFRAEFQRDVVIDMYCFRKRGHNEGDEPAFTQPLLYKEISQRKPIREGYLDHLLKQGGVTREEADEISSRPRKFFEEELLAARRQSRILTASAMGGIWRGYIGGPESETQDVPTGVASERAKTLLQRLATPAEGFTPHPKIKRLLDARLEMSRGEKPLDWAAGEALALASLAAEGMRIRMTGQDAERGTFSHRHALLHDNNDGTVYEIFNHVSDDQALVEIHNSALSEMAVLGFEYGYSLDTPDGLTIWEAQFGDFVNVAQCIIDQFIVSAEAKWQRLSGLVMLLPHGLEGAGPEHSSARLERFLELAATDNIQIVNLTTPAQFFHCLRRQMLRKWRKPLVVMSPKSLLRHPQVVSTLGDIENGAFQRIIPDTVPRDGPPSHVVLCTGKIYYELAAVREERKRHNVAIVRVEQLYPLPNKALAEVMAPYPEGTPVFWVQEEPENMGAWSFVRLRFGESLVGRLKLGVIARPVSSSPATGSPRIHRLEQQRIIDQAIGE